MAPTLTEIDRPRTVELDSAKVVPTPATPTLWNITTAPADEYRREAKAMHEASAVLSAIAAGMSDSGAQADMLTQASQRELGAGTRGFPRYRYVADLRLDERVIAPLRAAEVFKLEELDRLAANDAALLAIKGISPTSAALLRKALADVAERREAEALRLPPAAPWERAEDAMLEAGAQLQRIALGLDECSDLRALLLEDSRHWTVCARLSAGPLAGKSWAVVIAFADLAGTVPDGERLAEQWVGL